MNDPIFSPDYWKIRLAEAARPRDAVYPLGAGGWVEMDALWRASLVRQLAADTAVLDVGCGYGRLLDLMPPHWRGTYVGVDISPDMIGLARAAHPDQTFLVHDFRDRRYALEDGFDLAVFGMVRGMVRLNEPEAWPGILENVRRCAKNVLYLEEFGEDAE